MSQKKLSRIQQNMLAGLVCQVVTILVGFLLPRLYLSYYGSDVNGELNTIKQLFAYLYLLEAGVGLATTQALYRPVALEDHQSVSEVLAATNHYYRRTGLLYAAIVLGIGTIYPMVVRFSLPRGVILLYTILYGLPSVVSFLVQGKYRLLMEVDGRSYILSGLNTVVQLVSGIGKVAVLMLTQNILATQLLYCLCSMLPIPVILWYVRRNYPWIDRRAKPNYAAVAQKNSVLLHQLSSVIFNNTDMVLLSYFCDFKAVSVYSVYNLFFTQISFVMTLVINSVSFQMGQLFQTDRKRFERVYDLYETVYLAFDGFCYAMTAVFLLPVIRIYTAGIHDANYIDVALILLFAGKAVIENGKNIYHQVIQYEGSFKETQWHAVVEMCINLVVTLIAIQFCGIYGCLIGTVAALVFRWAAVVWYSYRKILRTSIWPTVRKWLCNAVLFVLVVLILGVQSHPEWSLLEVVGKAILNGIWVAALFAAGNLLVNRGTWKGLCELYAERKKA